MNDGAERFIDEICGGVSTLDIYPGGIIEIGFDYRDEDDCEYVERILGTHSRNDCASDGEPLLIIRVPIWKLALKFEECKQNKMTKYFVEKRMKEDKEDFEKRCNERRHMEKERNKLRIEVLNMAIAMGNSGINIKLIFDDKDFLYFTKDVIKLIGMYDEATII